MAGIIRSLVRAGGTRLARKAAKAVPLVGTALAVGLVSYEIKKKGFVRGLINTALDATPVVGVAKNTIEIFTGDWLRDRENRNKIEEGRNGNQIQNQPGDIGR